MESRSSPSKVGADRAVTCWYSWVGWGWPGCSACWPNRPPAEDEQINKVRLRLVKNTYICWRRMNGMRICVWGGEREALRSSLGLCEGAQKFYSPFSHKNLTKLGACVSFLHWLHIETWLSASCDHQWWQWINAKILINWKKKKGKCDDSSLGHKIHLWFCGEWLKIKLKQLVCFISFCALTLLLLSWLDIKTSKPTQASCS